MNEEITKEILSENPIKKDSKFFYFIDSEGNVCKQKRGKKKFRKKKTIINYFDKFNLGIPKVLLNGYVSKKFKTVRRIGKNGAYIWFPPSLIGKTFQVILVPKEDWILSQVGKI